MGMSMMEKAALQMLQNMTGLTPEQMQDMANKAMTMLATLEERLKAIEEKVDRISQNTPDLISKPLTIEDKSNAKSN